MTTNNHTFEIYVADDGRSNIRVQFKNDSVWLNRQQLSALFDRDIRTLDKHINNVFKKGELDKKAVVAKFATTAADGKTYQVEHYRCHYLSRLTGKVPARYSISDVGNPTAARILSARLHGK